MKMDWNTDQDVKIYFENRHIVPSDDVWKQLSKELHKNPITLNPKKSWYWVVAVIWIIGMVSGTFIYQNNSTSSDKGTTAYTFKHQTDRRHDVAASTEAAPPDVELTSEGNDALSKSKPFSKTKAVISQSSVIPTEAAVKMVMHTDLLTENIALAEQKSVITERRDKKDIFEEKVLISQKVIDEGQALNIEKADIGISKAKQKARINPYALLAEAEEADNAGFIAKTFRSLQDKTETLIVSVNERNILK